jgi:hypothetical protein
MDSKIAVSPPIGENVTPLASLIQHVSWGRESDAKALGASSK